MRVSIHRLPGMVLTDHVFEVPLNYAQPAGRKITVFGREAVACDKEKNSLPWLIFFQGGPGVESPRPETSSGWLKRALQEYRVFLLDQRGTGLSSPVNYQILTRFGTPKDQADYLKNFRADSIVQDAEVIRRELVGKDNPWSALGQSYGGFCLTHYLSVAPSSLKEAIITGGLPPLNRSPDDVYRATYKTVIEKNRLYYERYPEDMRLAKEIAEHLRSHDILLPSGNRMSPRRQQQLGLAFGMSNGFEQVHYLLEKAFLTETPDRQINYTFLRGVDNTQSFETNPLYAVLQEPIYCEGTASNWSAERVRSEYPEFEIKNDQPVFFTGEMVYPWMFDEYKCLRPLKEAAELLAKYENWPQLYSKSVLQSNTVPFVAAMYYNDMYVQRTLSEETARNIRGIKLWVTSEYEHNGLRADGEKVLGRLLGMLHGEI